MMATMLDVSRHAGVSKATVSRVLNGTGQVKESTRQKVFTAMQAGLSPQPAGTLAGESHQQQHRSGRLYV